MKNISRWLNHIAFYINKHVLKQKDGRANINMKWLIFSDQI